MQEKIVPQSCWKLWAGCFAFALATIVHANSAEQINAQRAVCAERETLLQTLVEAHGKTLPSASAKPAEVNLLIMQARAACDDGRFTDAVALYDRLIGEFDNHQTAASR